MNFSQIKNKNRMKNLLKTQPKEKNFRMKKLI